MKFKEFTLDPFQEEAIQAIEHNQSVVVSAPTGSGKTLIADFIIEKHRNDPQRIIYTAPIKALSNQKYRDFAKEYGEENVGLMTGDIVINPSAKIIVMTTEIYRNMAVSNDSDLANLAYVIFDEIHYINDIERGYVWEESIIYSSEAVRFLCLSATIPNADEFSRWIASIKKHTVKTVTATKRNVPLQQYCYDYELGLTTLEKIKSAGEPADYRRKFHGKPRGRERFPAPSHLQLIKELKRDKLPAFYFSFSRRDCQEKCRELAKANLFPRNIEIMRRFNEKIKNAPIEINRLNSTRVLKETISQGIAFHHAGLLPIIKEAVEELFAQGLINVLYVTETFAVGINMPAKTVIFDNLRKYDGISFRNLNTKEFFQIAGRAGRRGIDSLGYVVVMIFRPMFRYQEVKAITTKDVEPIKSQFRLSINTVLNLINLHPPAEIERILRLSFYSYQKFGEKYQDIPSTVLMSRYNNIVKKLKAMGYVQDNQLTEKGKFSAKIYADEITMGELFATEFVDQLNEYQIMLLLCCLAYEERERTEIKKNFEDDAWRKLKSLLYKNEYLAHEKKFLTLETVTTFIYPLYSGKTFFDVLDLTNLLEGDLIRIYSQVLDRLGQIKKASRDFRIQNKLDNCKGIIEKALEGIYGV